MIDVGAGASTFVDDLLDRGYLNVTVLDLSETALEAVQAGLGARARYVQAVQHSLKPGGHIVVATFGPHGPDKCSGLDVVRSTPEALHAEFGSDFSRLQSATESHVTPRGTEQEFVYCYCRLPK